MTLVLACSFTAASGEAREATTKPLGGHGVSPELPENPLERASWLIRRMLEAYGGRATVDGVGTLRLDCTVAASGIESGVTTWLSFPNRFRRDMEAAGHTLTALIVPDGGYLISDGEGFPMSDVEQFEVEATLLRDPIVLLKSRRQETFLTFSEGAEVADGTTLEKLKIVVGGTTMIVFIEPEVGLVRRIRFPRLKNGRETDELIDVEFSDYQTVDGLTYPFRRESVEGTIVVKTLEVNPVLDRRLFHPPRVADPVRREP